jgi:ABC-type nitrate/sulfonate/bicarbonate transport system substrate-binding protein
MRFNRFLARLWPPLWDRAQISYNRSFYVAATELSHFQRRIFYLRRLSAAPIHFKKRRCHRVALRGPYHLVAGERPVMVEIRLALLRGVCQLPAYVAHAKGFFSEQVASRVSIAPSAWLIPEQLCSGTADFGVIPWTRVAAAEKDEAPLKIICGSGVEEAAIVVRTGITTEQVTSVAIPREGGIKDLTAMGLLESLGWNDQRVKHRRFPSGDGAIICLFGKGADAASMVEPYASMMEQLGIGYVVRRTGDLWPGAPGCSLTASAALIGRDPDLVQRVVNAYVEASAFVHEKPDAAAEIGAPFIGVHVDIVRRALTVNRPNVDAIRNTDAMQAVLKLMQKLGYVEQLPQNFAELRFLDRAQAALRAPV